MCYYYTHLSVGNTGLEEGLYNLLKVTQVISDRANIYELETDWTAKPALMTNTLINLGEEPMLSELGFL